MPTDASTSHRSPHTHSDAEDHITDARGRARQVLGAEAHLTEVSDWRMALVSARDALILVWLTWVLLQSLETPAVSGQLLVAFSIGVAMLFGISTGRSTWTRVRYYEAELDRERGEIQNNLEHEREEVRVLYAAKGFEGDLLEKIVDTLSADDDRLLRVMMEEELGLSMNHVAHPLVVGAWNFAGAVLAGGTLALPTLWLEPTMASKWVIGGGGLLLTIVSVVSARVTGRTVMEFLASGIVMAAVTGGIVFFLAQWLSSLGAVAVAS